jgi:putative transcriptional regulator
MEGPMLRSLYRAALSAARTIDSDASVRALLWRPPAGATAMAAAAEARSTAPRGSAAVPSAYAALLGDVAQSFYVPRADRSEDEARAPVASYLRRTFRAGGAAGVDEALAAVRELSRIVRLARDLGLPAPAGQPLAVPAVALEAEDVLLAGELLAPASSLAAAHTGAADVAVGALLVAHPLTMGAPFSRSVVLLTRIDPRGGAAGLILNRPWNDARRRDARVLGFDGGPVRPRRAALLRAHDALPAATARALPPPERIADGLFVAELRSPTDVAGVPDCRYFSGAAEWAPGQLSRELAQGCWISARTTPEFVWTDLVQRPGPLPPMPQPKLPPQAVLDAMPAFDSLLEAERARSSRAGRRYRDSLWYHTLRSMGGEFDQIARLAGISPNALFRSWMRSHEVSSGAQPRFDPRAMD